MVRIMTTTIIRVGVVAMLIGCMLVPNAVIAQENPHWNKNSCQTCHMAAAPTGGMVNLNAPDAEALCETCHGDRGDARPCRHMSGLPVGENNLPDIFSGSLKDGQIVCSTCHNIVYQCEHPSRQYSFMNPAFLRERASLDTGQFCFECHDASGYERLSPHAGVSGMPPRPTCLLCHDGLPETNSAGQLVVEFNMPHDLNDTCRGCHNVRPHPRSFSYSSIDEGWIHLVEPSEEIRENIRKSQAETGIRLPLNPLNGEVFCATCHNPHDFKVGGEHGSQVAGANARLRINDICQACHDK